MSFVIAPPGSGYSDGGISLPNYCSFVVQDDGSGGQVLLNGLGINDPTVSGAVDLETLFGSSFKSFPLLRAFRPTTVPNDLLTQMLTYLDITCYTWSGTAVTKMPAFLPNLGLGGGPADATYLIIEGPSVAGTWRVDLKLRHSITNGGFTMSLTLIPLNSGYSTGGFSLPDLISFCIADDGGGGELLVGMSSEGGYVNLQAEFASAGMLFNSIPLSSVFRKLTPAATDTAAFNRLITMLDVDVVPAASSLIFELPLVSQNAGGTSFPFVTFTRPAGGGESPPTGVWRVNFRLRHSIAE